MTNPNPTRAEVEAAVEKLANSHLGMSLEEWSAVSNTILTCAAENQALRERAEAAELRPQVADACLVDPTAAITAAWEAGRDAWISYMLQSKTPDKPAPPADPFAALSARLDAAWNDAIEAAAQKCRENSMSSMAGEKAIRALRRAAPTEGEA